MYIVLGSYSTSTKAALSPRSEPLSRTRISMANGVLAAHAGEEKIDRRRQKDDDEELK